jgi:hypothetical protein
MSYIRYSTPNAKGAIYAAVVDSIRDGSRVHQKQVANLGLVIDRDNGIFKNKERGIYCYTLDGGFAEAPAASLGAPVVPSGQEKLILDFGDTYIVNEYLKTLPFYPAINELMPAEKSTLMSLLFFRILTDKKAYCYAESWHAGNYACMLFPDAGISSQRVSEFLVRLGAEKTQRAFFAAYLKALYGENASSSILIDSTGLENASKMSITQLNNHNGDINMEVRLIYVVDRRNGMPIYFRYCPGNIVDVSTLRTTIAELRQYNISVDYAIVDAGYFSEGNIESLYKDNISFITRLAPNRKLFKETAETELTDIISARYAVRYGNRLVYVKCVAKTIYGHEGYVYVGVDADSRNTQIKRATFASMEDKLTAEETDSKLLKLGVFMLVSSEKMGVSEVLPLYYTRQQVEQVFDIGKSNADLLPLRIQKEETFRGHLVLTFIATAVLQQLQQYILKKKSKKDKINPEGAFFKLRNQKCKVYEDSIVPQEPIKDVNVVYRLLSINCPTSIERRTQCSCKNLREL